MGSVVDSLSRSNVAFNETMAPKDKSGLNR